MARHPRRNHTAVFKPKVALAALKGDKTLSELAEQLQCPPQPDHRLEDAAGGRCSRRLWRRQGRGTRQGRCNPDAGADRRTGAGQRLFRRCARQGGFAELSTTSFRSFQGSRQRDGSCKALS